MLARGSRSVATCKVVFRKEVGVGTAAWADWCVHHRGAARPVGNGAAGPLKLVSPKLLARLHSRLGAIAEEAGIGLTLPDAAERCCAEGTERR